jgi:hypothetical protein
MSSSRFQRPNNESAAESDGYRDGLFRPGRSDIWEASVRLAAEWYGLSG